MPAAALIDQIGDSDLFTGREVKRLLAEIAQDTSPYVKVRAAAEITGISRSTLKSAAPRYYAMLAAGERPPIRMRRTSTKSGAHWLFHEGDCWSLRRANPDANPTAPDTNDVVETYARKVCSEWLSSEG